MLIDRFGTALTYNDAFQLSHAGEVDDWTISAPPVTAQIAGAAGAFDFFGTAAYPFGPMTVNKSFMATASTWAGIETALDALEDNTIYKGEGRLWGIARDGTTHYWTYAKCTALDIGYRVDDNSPPFAGTAVFGQRVSIEFFCRTGEWYAEGSETTYFPRFDVKLLNGSNAVLSGGTISNVLSISCEERLDEAGAISFTVPATDSTVATLLSTAARFRIDFAGGTAVYGIIDKDAIDATAQQPNRTVYGANMLRELQHYSMGWWCFYDDKVILTEVLPDIVDGTNWTIGSLDSSGAKVYYRFDGDMRLAALIKIAEASGKHFRLTNTFRELEWGDFFDTVSPVTFYGRYGDGNYRTYDGIPVIASLEVTSDKAPVVNRIYPWGAGHDDGNLNRAKVSLFHLDSTDTRWANIKAKPGVCGAQTTVTAVGADNRQYITTSTTGFMAWPITQLLWCIDPDDLTQGLGYDFVVSTVDSPDINVRGLPTVPTPPPSFPAYLISNPQLYIEDATAYAADPHEAVVIFDDITLPDLSLESFAAAAAQLYDRAAQYLVTHKQAQVSYSLSVYNCPDSIRPGDLIHIAYTGAVTRGGVQVDWVSIDTDLNVINITRHFNADNSRSATIEVSNVEAQPANSSGAVSRAVGSVGYHAATVGALGTQTSTGVAGISTGEITPEYIYITLADNGTWAISETDFDLGMIFVLCVDDGSVSMFSLTGANHVAYEMLDPQEHYTATAGTDDMTNVYWSSDAYYIENKRGGTRSYYIWLHMARIE